MRHLNLSMVGAVCFALAWPAVAPRAGDLRVTGQFISEAPSGPPLVVASPDVVPNLNADHLDGMEAADFAPLVHFHDEIYYTESEVDSALAGKADSAHEHDDRYYTETELETTGSASVHWDNLVTVPGGFADGVDDDTQYRDGDGIVVSNATVSATPEALYSPGVLPRPNVAGPLVDRAGRTCADAISVAVRPNGRPVIACAAASRELLVGQCVDTSCSGINFSVFPYDVGSATSIAIRLDDKGDDFFQVVFSNSGNLTLVDQNGGGSSLVAGDGASMAFGQEGFPIISFAFGSFEVGFLKCENYLCNSFTQTEHMVGSNLSDHAVTHTGVALGPDGLPILAYRTDLEIGIMSCADAQCTTLAGGTHERIFDNGFNYVSDHALSLVVGEDGLPMVAFGITNGGGAGLFTGAVKQIDTVGEHAAVTIAGDGRPVVAYWDEVAGQMKMAHCRDEACSDWTALVVDSSASATVGSGVALSFGGDGRPLAVYLEDDGGTKSARALKCANSFCVPFFQRR